MSTNKITKNTPDSVAAIMLSFMDRIKRSLSCATVIKFHHR